MLNMKVILLAIEHGPVEIVDLPIKQIVTSHSYVNVYQRVTIIYPIESH
jgi:hypothetical protein